MYVCSSYVNVLMNLKDKCYTGLLATYLVLSYVQYNHYGLIVLQNQAEGSRLALYETNECVYNISIAIYMCIPLLKNLQAL